LRSCFVRKRSPEVFVLRRIFQAFRPLELKAADKDSDAVVEQKAFSPGSIIEFQEKNRIHVGKILQVERKSNGAVRYEVEEFPTGKHHNIADKEVSFSIPPPTNDKKAEKLLEQLEHAHELDEEDLRKELDISPELLEIAWEETVESEEMEELTPKQLVEIVHSHDANPIEKYEAWRLLRSDIGHVFFKDLKENGRVVAFKAKPKKSVEASKEAFCANNEEEEEFCDAPEDLSP